MTLLAPTPTGAELARDQPPLFAFVEDDHPFAPAIERFRERVASRADALAWRADPRTVVHTELKGAALPDGGFAIDRMYCSLQRSDDEFAALSLCFAARHGRTEWYAFPDEPYLAGLRPFVEGRALVADTDGAAFDVLRYVPLRRFTFRGRLRTRPGREVIGKVKRASRVHEARDRGVAIARAVAAAGRPFSVAAPLGIDAEHRISYQGVVVGRPLSDLVADPADVADAGAVQHLFHRLPARGLPAWDQDAFVRRIARDVEWIAFLRPETEPVVERVRRAIARAPHPLDEGATACCHGDWVCSHVYRSPAGFAVIDLDLAARADPHWEIAMALAALARDVPLLEAACSDPAADATAALRRAEAAYVDGYRAAARVALDERRLRFWRLCGEVYELALMLTKDRYAPVPFARALGRAGELAEHVMEDSGR
jgi:hypothetical protein